MICGSRMFLAPGSGLVEDSFSTDGSEGGRRMVQVECTGWGAVGNSS